MKLTEYYISTTSVPPIIEALKKPNPGIKTSNPVAQPEPESNDFSDTPQAKPIKQSIWKRSPILKGVATLAGGKEGVKKALITQAVHLLTGLPPDEVDHYYDKIKGTREGQRADFLYKAYRTAGITDFQSIDVEDFVTALDQPLKAMTSGQIGFFNSNTVLFAVIALGMAKKWAAKPGTSGLDSTPIDITKYLLVQDGIMKLYGSKMTRYGVRSLEATISKQISGFASNKKGSDLSPQKFLDLVSDYLLGAMLRGSMIEVRYPQASSGIVRGATFAPGNLIDIYNALKALTNTATPNSSPQVPRPGTPPITPKP